ncbi:hypothetical protein Tco_1193421 [Tanacetum coccineum]
MANFRKITNVPVPIPDHQCLIGLWGLLRETLAEGKLKWVLHLGPERPRVYSDLDIYTLINHYTDAKDIWDNVKMLLEGGQDNVVDEDVDEQPVHDLALNVEIMSVLKTDDCVCFDSDVDRGSYIAQTMFMENLSSAMKFPSNMIR